jgi:hypothetical protein
MQEFRALEAPVVLLHNVGKQRQVSRASELQVQRL